MLFGRDRLSPPRRRGVLVAFVGAAFVGLLGAGAGGGHVGAAADLPPPQPVPSLPALASTSIDEAQGEGLATARLVEVPVGCAEQRREQAVFIGTLVLRDAATARFRVDQLRSGSLVGYTVGGLVDVRYGDDVRFLDDEARYLVGVGVDRETRLLVSSVRDDAPLFGGSQLDATPGAGCPVLADPVRTVHLDGTPIDSGVLSGLLARPGLVARAVLVPVAVVLAALVVLAGVKLVLAGAAGAMRRLG